MNTKPLPYCISSADAAIDVLNAAQFGALLIDEMRQIIEERQLIIDMTPPWLRVPAMYEGLPDQRVTLAEAEAIWCILPDDEQRRACEWLYLNHDE